jgi:hypothetical protein
MSNAALWPTSTVSWANAWKAGSTVSIVGWPRHHLRADAVDRHRGLGDRPPRIDELLEALVPAQLAVDDARRADLDDLVAGRRVEPVVSQSNTV